MTFTENILAAYTAASEQDRIDGMAWYDSARTLAYNLCPNSVETGAGIIAALSPNTSWPQNIIRARTFVETGTVGAFPDAVAKARRILSGESPLDVLRGNKVRAFYLNIMGINSEETVTVDRHAIDIAHGRTMSDTERAPWFRKRKNAELVAAYLTVASDLGLTGAELQAITWVYWRRERAVANHGSVKR